MSVLYILDGSSRLSFDKSLTAYSLVRYLTSRSILPSKLGLWTSLKTSKFSSLADLASQLTAWSWGKSKSLLSNWTWWPSRLSIAPYMCLNLLKLSEPLDCWTHCTKYLAPYSLKPILVKSSTLNLSNSIPLDNLSRWLYSITTSFRLRSGRVLHQMLIWNFFHCSKSRGRRLI